MGDLKNLTLAENAKTQGKHLSIFWLIAEEFEGYVGTGHKLWTGSEEEMGT